ncbi:MAG: HEAT repeat domain-containing protein [Planctomycetes bacterium]|nr:HEAT repeat domain-containing protein [Planctomycetota bacterium]
MITIKHFILGNLVLIIPPILALTAWLMARRLGWIPKQRALASSAPSGNRITRTAEAVVLLCAVTAIFVFTATNTSTGGRLLILDQFRPGFAATNIAVAVVMAVGVAVGILIALLWRTLPGVIIAAIVLCCYGLVLNGPEQLLESLAPEGSTVPDASLTFQLSSPDVDGAELWVNGVRLGTLPFETTFEEFLEKVPYWAEEPNENKWDNKDLWLFSPSYERPGRSGGGYSRPFAPIELPKEPTRWREHRRRILDPNERKAERKTRTYYVRVALGDEWGYNDGGTGSSGGGGGRYNRRRAVVSFGFVFPQRQKRIEKLLDIARLNDYQPGPQWFEVMQTYRSDGWVGVREAMDTEPDMIKLLDAWATWRYELDKVTDSKSAWRAFARICNEADDRQYYLTSAIAGRSVELLVPKLEPERLVQKAVKLIRSARMFGWYYWRMNDCAQFGYTNLPQGLYTGSNSLSGQWTGGRGGRLPISGYVVAHSVWRLHELLQCGGDHSPNIVQEEVVPEMVRWHYNKMSLLRIACYFGGAQFARFLLRQKWRTDPQDLPWKEQMHIHGGEVNGWLYLLSHIGSPAGGVFRQEHTERIFKLADSICEEIRFDWDSIKRELDFLFYDLDKGRESLAYRYWPKLRQDVQTSRHYVLRTQWQYLVQAEPVSTAQMYLDAWRSTKIDHIDCSFAWRLLEELPDDKRKAVAAAVLEQVQKDVSNLEDWRTDTDQRRKEVIRITQPHLEDGNADQRQANRILASLRDKNGKYKPAEVSAWVEEGRPGHPLVSMLVDSNEPELRLLVMGVLKEHPTPANRAILQKLLQDSDEEVRKAAEEVAAELKALAEMSVKKLVAVPNAGDAR